MAETQNAANGLADAEFVARVLRYLDDALAPDELAAMNRELAADPAKRVAFVRLSVIESLTAEELAPRPGAIDYPAAATNENADPFASDESAASGFIGWPDEPAIASAPLSLSRRPSRPHRQSHWRLYATAAMVMIVIGIAWVLQRPQPTPSGPVVAVATIATQSNARWEGRSAAVKEGLAASTTLKLASGYISLHFSSGADVIIEAPAQFTVTSASAMSLSSGKLAATMKGGGFAVSTPTAALLDLGTEFGVGLEPGGATRVEVFDGSVQVSLRGTKSAATPAQLVTAGDAATVSSSAVTPEPGGASSQHFVRSLVSTDQPLDVVDLLAGGDGTTHQRGVEIDVITGQFGKLPPVGTMIGHHQYVSVPGLSVVDGCFVPAGGDGPEQVDSRGHTFAFPPTANRTFGTLGVGSASSARHTPAGSNPQNGLSVLGGIDYTQPGHGLLLIHSNKGVTLDLDAIRRLHPGTRLGRFRCLVGNSYPRDGKNTPRADAWVIVDGQSRFERRGFTNRDDPFAVDVPLEPTDRFLTLVTTDGGDGTGYDWILWADPQLAAPVAP